METFSALLAICSWNAPVIGEFPHKGQWRGAMMFSLICTWINGWVNSCEAGNMRRHRAHYNVTLMISLLLKLAKHLMQYLAKPLNIISYHIYGHPCFSYDVFSWRQVWETTVKCVAILFESKLSKLISFIMRRPIIYNISGTAIRLLSLYIHTYINTHIDI